jgi:hypothetical protein
MSDIYSILQSSYTAVGSATNSSRTPYVPVDATFYQGTWSGAYPDNTKFTIQVSNVTGFRATVRYQSGSTVSSQDVLIKDNSFRFGDSKFTLTQAGTAQINTVNAKGAVDTANATQDIPPASPPAPPASS